MLTFKNNTLKNNKVINKNFIRCMHQSSKGGNFLKSISTKVNSITGCVKPKISLTGNFKEKQELKEKEFKQNEFKEQQGSLQTSSNFSDLKKLDQASSEIETKKKQELEEETKQYLHEIREKYLNSGKPLVSEIKTNIESLLKENAEYSKAIVNMGAHHPQVFIPGIHGGFGSITHSLPSLEFCDKKGFFITNFCELEVYCSIDNEIQIFLTKILFSVFKPVKPGAIKPYAYDLFGYNWSVINKLFNSPDKELNERNIKKVENCVANHNANIEKNTELAKERYMAKLDNDTKLAAAKKMKMFKMKNEQKEHKAKFKTVMEELKLKKKTEDTTDVGD